MAEENQRRLDRQRSTYAEDLPLWQRYERACDFLEDDLDSVLLPAVLAVADELRRVLLATVP